MGKLTTFNFITLDGYYKDSEDDISWHQHDAEGNDFSVEMMKANNTLLFGRKTYEMMAGFWPSKEAMAHMPEVAKGMNAADKIVFSKTLKKVAWNNTVLMKDNLVDEVTRLKKSGKNITILGSGSIITQLAEHNLIDEYTFMLDPTAIGMGTPLFKGLRQPLELKLIYTKTFKSGAVLLTYEALSSNP